MGDRGVAPFRLAHVVEKHQRGVLELADQRVIIYHPRLGQARHLRARRKGFLGIDPAIEVILDVLGRKRGTAVELDVLPEMECPRQPVRRDLPALRQPGADLHLEVVEHEPVVQEQVGGDGGEPRGAPRVERVGVVIAPDGERAAALGLVLGLGKRSTGTQRGRTDRAELQ